MARKKKKKRPSTWIKKDRTKDRIHDFAQRERILALVKSGKTKAVISSELGISVRSLFNAKVKYSKLYTDFAGLLEIARLAGIQERRKFVFPPCDRGEKKNLVNPVKPGEQKCVPLGTRGNPFASGILVDPFGNPTPANPDSEQLRNYINWRKG